MLQYAETLDRAFGALADPARRSMVARLARGPASVSELTGPLEMSLSAVVQHLHVLEDSGLVSSAKVGRVRTCRLEKSALRAVERWIGDPRATWERPLDRLATVLEEEVVEQRRGRAARQRQEARAHRAGRLPRRLRRSQAAQRGH